MKAEQKVYRGTDTEREDKHGRRTENPSDEAEQHGCYWKNISTLSEQKTVGVVSAHVYTLFQIIMSVIFA